MARIVLDTSSLLVFFENTSGAAKVESALLDAVEKQHAVSISATSWGELKVALARQHSPDVASRKLRQLEQLGVSIETIDSKLSQAAADLAMKCGVPYHSCLGVAVAVSRKATLLTADKALKDMPRVSLV